MQDWTGGYVTEIEYTSGFYVELTPVRMNFAALCRGFAAPPRDQPYNWLEIGCGNGLSANGLAATNAHANFFAFDFNPAHIQNAQALARDAGLRNVQFFEDSFEEALRRELPPMDYIVLHGIYSWVNAANRDLIVALIRRLLKPGGMVYISYNCLPGWSNKAPLRRLMTEYASRRGGPMGERVEAARDFLGTMKEAGMRYFNANPSGAVFADHLISQNVSYLAHEYMNADWELFYHADIVRDMAAAKLTFAASATLAENVDGATMMPAVAALVRAESDPVLRETLRDFAVNQQFRRDLFLRGAVRLSASEQASRLGATRVCMARTRAECKLTVNLPVGEVSLPEKLYVPILDALGERPHTVAELAGATGADLAACITAVTLLLSLNYVVELVPGRAETQAACQAFNIAALNRAVSGAALSVLAAANLGTPIGVGAADQYMLHAYLSKADDAVAHLQAILRNVNQQVVENGKPLESDQAKAYLQKAYQRFLSDSLPFYRTCGILV